MVSGKLRRVGIFLGLGHPSSVRHSFPKPAHSAGRVSRPTRPGSHVSVLHHGQSVRLAKARGETRARCRVVVRGSVGAAF
jgi:hypothetical protein